MLAKFSAVLGSCLVACSLGAETISEDRIRAAAEMSISLLQQTSQNFYKTQSCFSCHHQGSPMMALRLARERGIPVDEAAALDVARKAFAPLASIDHAVQANFIIDPSMGDGSWLVAAHDAGVAPSLTTAIYAARIANHQRAGGHWRTLDQRPPTSYSLFTATAIALRAVQLYSPEQLGEDRLRRARQWLISTEPKDTEDFTFRLLGLGWARAAENERRKAAEALLALQKPDGGWPQLASRSSDAYATGEALVALHTAGGIPVSHPAWQKGLRFLLQTQKEDGSWLVQTRMVSPAPVSPPYFESGFPHGKHQFASTAATAWAASALMLALPKTAQAKQPQAIPEAAPEGVQPWMRAALLGNPEELRKLLDQGLSPNSKTPAGTTLLMMASADPEKVKLLIERGADVKAIAKTGYTALMVASLYQGTAPSLRLLLGRGAEASPGKGIFFNASPLFLAAFTGDRENVSLLKARGADVHRKMLLLGQFGATPLLSAVFFDDAALLRDLVRLGANPREKDQENMTPLHWAALANRREAAKALIDAGADINAVDNFGYTPLMYAATIDFGDTGVLSALLENKANPAIRNKEGRSALAQARHFNYPAIRAALEAAGAPE